MKLNKTQIKEMAQKELMGAMQIAFSRIYDTYNQDFDLTMTPKEKQNLVNVMSDQFGRVEKLFGYEVGSWTRGC